VESPEYKNIFPGVSTASRAEGHWELEPPNKGEFHAAGIRSGITGKGAELLVIDDPFKNREEAESKRVRSNTTDAYKSTLSTRLHYNALVWVMATRWHLEDLSGWLLKHADPPFKYICLSALALDNDPLGRYKSEALWPRNFPQHMLLKQKQQLGSYEFGALYQGYPLSSEGKKFQRSFFQIVKEAPEGLNWVRYWDLATSLQRTADFTACVAMATDEDGNVYLRDMIRNRWEWPDVRRVIKETCQTEPETFCGVESQGMQKGMIQELWRDNELINHGLVGIPVTKDKGIRSMGAQARGEARKLFLVEGDWNDAFIQECVDFPQGEHDDQVDTMSGGFAMLGYSTGGIS